MNKAVELLKEERKELKRTIKWIEPEISGNTRRIEVKDTRNDGITRVVIFIWTEQKLRPFLCIF